MRALVLSVAALSLSTAVAADTAYVKPSDVSPEMGQTISVEVAFNDVCCEPKYAVRTDTFAVIGSDGDAVDPDRIEIFSTVTVLEHTFTQTGTSRITTGERLGRKGEYVLLDGTYHLVNSPDAEPIDVPEGAPILTSQTATVTDAYVTVGAPDWGAIRRSVGRLAIEPALHPSGASVGLPFIGRVTFDGDPVPGQDVFLTNEAQRLSGKSGWMTQTDDEGLFTIPLNDPGVSLLMVRMQAPAPQDAETDIRSYTTALTLNVSAD
ncbi:MAG: DUF4198 domain-containing protein [Pseudomonadota bacterium]